MSSEKQLIGMRGVYLVAAELSGRGFIASPTSRSARGADILCTDAECKRAFSVQVKTKSTQTSYWLLSRDYKRFVSDSHIYVFVNIKEGGVPAEFFIVPSAVVAKEAYAEPFGKDIWHSFTVERAKPFQDKWEIFRGSFARTADSSSKNAVSISSACTTKRFPSS
jgi:hypothetical protein